MMVGVTGVLGCALLHGSPSCDPPVWDALPVSGYHLCLQLFTHVKVKYSICMALGVAHCAGLLGPVLQWIECPDTEWLWWQWDLGPQTYGHEALDTTGSQVDVVHW